MKQFVKLLTILLITSATQVIAQTTPDVDFKGTRATTSDPLMKENTLNISIPKALAGFSLNFSSPDALQKFNMSFMPVMELLTLLENKGAKVTATPVQIKDLLTIQVAVDGKKLDDLIVVQCNDCVIIYEY